MEHTCKNARLRLWVKPYDDSPMVHVEVAQKYLSGVSGLCKFVCNDRYLYVPINQQRKHFISYICIFLHISLNLSSIIHITGVNEGDLQGLVDKYAGKKSSKNVWINWLKLRGETLIEFVSGCFWTQWIFLTFLLFILSYSFFIDF